MVKMICSKLTLFIPTYNTTLHPLRVELLFRLLCCRIGSVQQSKTYPRYPSRSASILPCPVSQRADQANVSVRWAVIDSRLWKFMTREGRRRGGWVTDGRFWLPNCLVQLADEVFKVLQATFADLPEVLPERNLQLLLQVGVFGHQHLYHHAKCLAVLTVHLEVDRNTSQNKHRGFDVQKLKNRKTQTKWKLSKHTPETHLHPFVCRFRTEKCREGEVKTYERAAFNWGDEEVFPSCHTWRLSVIFQRHWAWADHSGVNTHHVVSKDKHFSSWV